MIGALDGEGADVAAGPIVSAAGPGSTALGPAGGGPRWHEGASRRPWSIASGGNLAVRRDRFLEVGGFDLRMGPGGPGRAAEDIELVARLLAAGARVRWRPDMVVRRVGPAARPRGGGRDGFGAGRMARRLGAPALAVGYAADVSRTVAAAIRDGSVRRLGEAASAGVGFAAGFATPDRARSPVALLDRLPATIRRALHGRRLRPWPVPHRSRPHLLWAAGDDLVLHLYVGVADGFTAGAPGRDTARRAGIAGVPAIVEMAVVDDEVWVLEERRPGRRRDPRVDAGRRLGGRAARTAGTPLRETGWWSRAGGPAAAMEALGDLPAVVVHGDLQAKNLLVDRAASIGVLDWEGAEDVGPPGFDLLFLAVGIAHVARRSAGRRSRRWRRRDPAGLAVQERLRAVGLDDGTARAALAVALHHGRRPKPIGAAVSARPLNRPSSARWRQPGCTAPRSERPRSPSRGGPGRGGAQRHRAGRRGTGRRAGPRWRRPWRRRLGPDQLPTVAQDQAAGAEDGRDARCPARHGFEQLVLDAGPARHRGGERPGPAQPGAYVRDVGHDLDAP